MIHTRGSTATGVVQVVVRSRSHNTRMTSSDVSSGPDIARDADGVTCRRWTSSGQVAATELEQTHARVCVQRVDMEKRTSR